MAENSVHEPINSIIPALRSNGDAVLSPALLKRPLLPPGGADRCAVPLLGFAIVAQLGGIGTWGRNPPPRPRGGRETPPAILVPPATRIVPRDPRRHDRGIDPTPAGS